MRTWASTLIEDWCGVHKQKGKGISFVCLNVTRSQLGGQEGELVAAINLITPVHLVSWMGCLEPVYGEAEALEK